MQNVKKYYKIYSKEDLLYLYENITEEKRTNYKTILQMKGYTLTLNFPRKILIFNKDNEIRSYSGLVLTKLIYNAVRHSNRYKRRLLIGDKGFKYQVKIINDYLILITKYIHTGLVIYFNLCDYLGFRLKLRKYNNNIEIYSDVNVNKK